jgi:rubrerythrin
MCGGILMDFRFECPHIAPSFGSPQFVGDPALIFLREDIADELGAMVGYLECAGLIKDYRISERFREVANDEMGHFNRLMGMLATLDPVQADEFKKHDLLKLFVQNEATVPLGVPVGIPSQCQACSKPERHRHDYIDKRPLPVDEHIIECLRNAIRDEFYAINAYQKQITTSTNPVIQNLLTTIMNKEKEHVSEFTQLFYAIYRE